MQFTNVCAIVEYGVGSGSHMHPDHCDVLKTPDSK